MYRSKNNSETNDISFESPDIELPDSEIKMVVASSGGLPHPPGVRLSFEGDYLSRATIYCVITVCGEKLLSFMNHKVAKSLARPVGLKLFKQSRGGAVWNFFPTEYIRNSQ